MARELARPGARRPRPWREALTKAEKRLEEFDPAELEALAEARLWPRVDRVDDVLGCWPWLGPINRVDYGSIQFRGHSFLVHRVAYAVAYGPIPQGHGYHGTVIRHKCDNPVCCNPRHLEPGTQRDNCRDRSARGRSNQPAGGARSNAKLCPFVVDLIASSGLPDRQLAEMFKISKGTVAKVRAGRHWACR